MRSERVFRARQHWHSHKLYHRRAGHFRQKGSRSRSCRTSDSSAKLIDSVADLIFVKDLSGTFVLANQALKEGCGDIVGLRAADFFPSGA